ncbi:hypothetical protein SteCoe_21123 [Stentor coeruleus]|uniref:RBR-type E3 ubiquitin transferase n=1 Tax=Stentor coeruleus TaxID=5963 RepID=A0A1R2BQB3_9CILI|nr:hypothetical protein SteCoe_21123 [Stentor coeruleus]
MFCKLQQDEAVRKNRLDQYIRSFEREVNRVPQNIKLIQEFLQSIIYFKSQDFIRIEQKDLPDKNQDRSINPFLKSNPSSITGQTQDFSELSTQNSQELRKKPLENFNNQVLVEEKQVEEPRIPLNNQGNFVRTSVYQKNSTNEINLYKRPGPSDHSQPKNFQKPLEKNLSFIGQDPKSQKILKTSDFIEETTVNQDIRLKDQKNLHVEDTRKCFKCYDDGVTYECSHKLCRGCLKKEYFRISKGSFMGRMRCTECNIEIDVNKYIGAQIKKQKIESIEKLKRQFLIDATASYFECPMCKEQILVSESITLSCDHRFCEPCTKDYLTEKIKSNNIKKIVCPKCSKGIDNDVIKVNVDKTTFDIYCTLQNIGYHSQDDDMHIKECYKCGQFLEIPKKSTNFMCPGCKIEYCTQCNSIHEEKSCKDFQKKQSTKGRF